MWVSSPVRAAKHRKLVHELCSDSGASEYRTYHIWVGYDPVIQVQFLKTCMARRKDAMIYRRSNNG
jgi:hypothetical protein